MPGILIGGKTPEEMKRKRLEEMARQREVPPSHPGVPPSPPPAGSSGFSIEEIAKGYRIAGIDYRGGIVAYDFAKNTLPSRTQEQHAEHAIKAGPDEFIAASAPLVYAICKTLYQNRDGKQKELVEKARQALEGIIGPGKLWVHTLSRAIYNTNGEDEIIHDYKQKTQYPRKASIVGKKGYIIKPETNATESIQAILDTTDNTETINDIFKWITGKNTYEWRINTTPETKEARAVVFGGVDVYTGIICSANTDGSGLACGVRAAEISGGS